MRGYFYGPYFEDDKPVGGNPGHLIERAEGGWVPALISIALLIGILVLAVWL